MSFFLFRIGLFAAVSIAVCGCTNVTTRDLSAPQPNPGLDTIPYYRKGFSEFSSQGAVREHREVKKGKAEVQAEFAAAVKERFAGFEFTPELPDPWTPPEPMDPAAVPAAIRGFPTDKYGYPDWSVAAREGLIQPSDTILEAVREKGTDADKEKDIQKDILFKINDRLMADVLFPHQAHTYWLSCKNCHPAIFKDKEKANTFTMYDIWNGEYCGRCHGKVAFQPKGFENCRRCHSVPKKEFYAPDTR
ncbi:MAG: c(7)-type cytochrome triheme domain-containing protein [Thermodesulfobacteriota bacterium]